MLRRALAIMFSGILCCSALGYGPARAQSQEATRSAEKARAEVQKLGVNPQRRVEVKLQDGTKLKGSISAVEENTFTITDAQTGAPRTVAYADVARVKEPGGGFSARSLAIIGAAAAAVVIVGVVVFEATSGDCGAGC